MRDAEAEERAYSEILHAIVRQRYMPGDRLTEAKVAEDLNMSRTPVRGALKKMAACGMLEYVKNIGCRVPVLTPYDMESVFQTREILESKAAALATMRATNVEVENLFKLLEEEKDYYRKGDVASYAGVNERIHLGVGMLSKNAYVERYLSQCYWRSELYIFFFDRFYDKGAIPTRKKLWDPSESKSCREHDALVEAIASGKAEAAASVMSEHIKSTYLSLTRREWV
ncbi:GntR family transcriptional regulator [Cloacibacillus sp. An23]|uniref:GntR family transcriptional regulator n=1 Tax=Cloacibacillus sp. An23 TaxID=1965591 RepID=UPI000B3A77A5|nr:GntR family transcriptional regulator [Cloacibacillus sp. An23]OUO93958.1 GntR family transcriptional regulator [Cloacibacillus sp. An23]